MGLVEVVVSAAVFLLVAGTAMTTLTSAEVGTKGAQTQESAVSLAQREVERMRERGYAALGLASLPTAAASGADINPTNPNEYVSGTRLLVRSNFHDRGSALAPDVPVAGEPLVTVATGGVATGPERVTTGTSAFDVYRYATRMDMQCMVGATDKCPGTDDAKRIVVAIRPVTATGQKGPVKPVWISTVLTNPAALVAGATPPPPVSGATNATAQPLFLYDTACNQAARQPIAASHDVHDTAAATANCAAAGSGARLDLMGATAPPAAAAGSPDPPFYDYALDHPTARTGARGVALAQPAGTGDCVASEAVALTSPHTLHRWASTAIPAAGFQSGTRSALSVFTSTVNGAEGEATLCLRLLKMSTLGVTVALPSFNSVVSHRIVSWPRTATEIRFAFTHSTPFSLASGERLVLALWIAGSSVNEGIEIHYDHPQADSVLSVSTTTPFS